MTKCVTRTAYYRIIIFKNTSSRMLLQSRVTHEKEKKRNKTIPRIFQLQN